LGFNGGYLKGAVSDPNSRGIVCGWALPLLE
jgi:hypothetical protein